MSVKTSTSDSGSNPIRPRRVQLLPDTAPTFTDLWLAVYVEGPSCETRPFAEMFVKTWCRKAETPDDADLVVFAGGEDVNPIYYDEEPHPQCRFSSQRDERDTIVYAHCLEKGIPMLGICRGAQFLHVMNGGKLYQHIDNHVGDHPMYDVKSQVIIDKVSSVHHQSCIPNPAGGMEILGTTQQSRTRWKNKTDKNVGILEDVEAFFYRDTCCLGIQGHPEYKGYDQFLKWTFQQINDHIVCNPDIKLSPLPKGGSGYRLRPELIEQRSLGWAERAKELN